MGRKQRKKKRGQAGPTRAQRADLFGLYEEAVQDPDGDCSLVRRIYQHHYTRSPRTLREDFCGTAALACSWVRSDPEGRAWGVDLDPAPLAWCRANHLERLGSERASRVQLLEGDVMEVAHEPVDVTVAFNFSYFVFHSRRALVDYFTKARSTLGPEGLFVIDLYGGADAQRTLTETREHDDFDYVWDQDAFDPIHHRASNFIHFEFSDGSSIEEAFHYDWRLWTIPEVRDALEDAGFSATEAYWEGTDRKTNEGTGEYHLAEEAPDDPAWVAYVAARA